MQSPVLAAEIEHETEAEPEGFEVTKETPEFQVR